MKAKHIAYGSVINIHNFPINQEYKKKFDDFRVLSLSPVPIRDKHSFLTVIGKFDLLLNCGSAILYACAIEQTNCLPLVTLKVRLTLRT